MNIDSDVVYKQPKTDGERAEVADACVRQLDFHMPMVLDKLSNEVDLAYSALPERLYVIDREGVVAWRSGMGPWDFDIDGWVEAIEAELS